MKIESIRLKNFKTFLDVELIDSPDFLNAVNLEEVFRLVKKDDFTKVFRAKDNEQIAAYMAEGDKMGYLWIQGFFTSNPGDRS